MKECKRIRQWMEVPGRFQPGKLNSITDVEGVTVGHCTLIESDTVRSGVTVVKPHQGNVFLHRVPAATFAGNGHTKAGGSLQVEELGELESYIALTSTLSVGPVMEGLLECHKKDMAEASFRSLNVFVMETNDGELSDIMGNHVRPHHVAEAIKNCGVDVEEGGVGAGTGCTCFGYKGGIGTSSRIVRGVNIDTERDFTVGVMVQANYGGNLNVYGHQLPYKPLYSFETETTARGSCSVVVATDAPLSERQLKRLAKRAIVGLGTTGSPLGNSSGDFVLAFSNYEKNIRNFESKKLQEIDYLCNDRMNPFFEATIDATREAVYNCLCMAQDMRGFEGAEFKGFDITQYADIIPLK